MIVEAGGASLQTTSSTTSTSQVEVLSIAVVLILAWVACAILIGAGLSTKRNQLIALGVIGAGIMTVLTPLVYYVSETLRLGVYEASIQDFMLLAGLSTLGGGIIALGALRLVRHGTSS